MTIDPRTSLQFRDGARRGSTDQADICLHQARSAVTCSANRVKGELYILPRTACETDLHMDDTFNELIYFPVWPLPETAMNGGTM